MSHQVFDDAALPDPFDSFGSVGGADGMDGMDGFGSLDGVDGVDAVEEAEEIDEFGLPVLPPAHTEAEIAAILATSPWNDPRFATELERLDRTGPDGCIGLPVEPTDRLLEDVRHLPPDLPLAGALRDLTGPSPIPDTPGPHTPTTPQPNAPLPGTPLPATSSPASHPEAPATPHETSGLSSLDEDELRDVLAGWERLISWARAAQARVAQELMDRTGPTLARDSTAGEISGALHVTSSEAWQIAIRAEGTRTHPAVAHALTCGQIDTKKADTLLRSGSDLTPAERDEAITALLPAAPSHTWKWLSEQLVAHAARLHGPRTRHRDIINRANVWAEPAGPGMGRITADLPVDETALVFNTLQSAAGALKNVTGENRPLGALRAAALTALLTGRLVLPCTDNDTPDTNHSGTDTTGSHQPTPENGQARRRAPSTTASRTDGTGDAGGTDGTGDTGDTGSTRSMDRADDTSRPHGTGRESGMNNLGSPRAAIEEPIPAAPANLADPAELGELPRLVEPVLDTDLIPTPDTPARPTRPVHADRPTRPDTTARPGTTETTAATSEPASEGRAGHQNDAEPVDPAAGPDRASPPGPSAVQTIQPTSSNHAGGNNVDPTDGLGTVMLTGPVGQAGGTRLRVIEVPATVHVTIPASVLLDPHDMTPGILAGIGPIPAQDAARIAANGTWRRLLTDPTSGILTDYSTHTYTPGTILRAAITTRDHTCRFPGCDRPAVSGNRATTDLDHINPFDHHQPAPDEPGQTRATNLHPLCRKHHLLKTHAGWTVTRDPATGHTHWKAPTGNTDTTEPTIVDPVIRYGLTHGMTLAEPPPNPATTPETDQNHHTDPPNNDHGTPPF